MARDRALLSNLPDGGQKVLRRVADLEARLDELRARDRIALAEAEERAKVVSNREVSADDRGAGPSAPPVDGDAEGLAEALEALDLQKPPAAPAAPAPPLQDVTIPPGVLKVGLYLHQREAVGFMRALEESRGGGILADDMGLGKTLTVLAVCETDDGSRAAPTLIIGPQVLLDRWRDEIQTKVARDCVTLVYHGPKRKDLLPRMSKASYVLTTYGTVTSEARGSPRPPNEPLPEKPASIFDVGFRRVVLDEAHEIRNDKTKISVAVTDFRADRRWCVTGTPLQNSYQDLFSLFRFLRLRLPGLDVTDRTKFKSMTDRADGPLRLRKVLSEVLLRRGKECLAVSLPPRSIVNVGVTLSPDERLLYDNVLTICRRAALEASTKMAALLTLFLRSRQLCCHPAITRLIPSKPSLPSVPAGPSSNTDGDVEGDSDGGDGTAGVDDEVGDMAGTLRDEQLAAGSSLASGVMADLEDALKIDFASSRRSAKVEILLRELQLVPPEDKAVVFSQWTSLLDVVSEHLNEAGVHHERLQGSLTREGKTAAIKRFASDPKCRVMLISLKAGGVGINLVFANHLFLLDPWFNPQIEMQCFDRLWRIGQAKPVFIRRYIARDSVEEKILVLQQRKMEMAKEVLDKQNSESSSTKNPAKLYALTERDIRGAFR
jgi:SNF2 family DNA or RNA helicase